MIVTSTAPCRISLFGGSTDLPTYADPYGGLVINMAINLRQHIKIATEEDIFKINLRNTVPLNGNKDFMHKIFTDFGIGGFAHVRFESESDVPLESGIGASAATAVATVAAINKAKKLNMDKGEIAERAWDIEVNKLNLFGGRQDQYASAFGGVNSIVFSKDKVEVIPTFTNFVDSIYPSLVLFYTGKNRTSPTIQEGFKQLTFDQIQVLNQIKQIATAAVEPIAEGDIERVGNLLHRAWRLKQRSNKGVSEPWIDKIYEKGKKAGALGGKLCGSGGGGYMIFIVKPNKKDEFINQMENQGVEWYDFSIDFNGVETRII